MREQNSAARPPSNEHSRNMRRRNTVVTASCHSVEASSTHYHVFPFLRFFFSLPPVFSAYRLHYNSSTDAASWSPKERQLHTQ